jgi:DNA-binding NtrC family response regulator
MRRVLLAWIGVTDLRAPLEEAVVGLGPLAQALGARAFDEAVLIAYFSKPEHAQKVEPYIRWSSSRTKTTLKLEHAQLTSPTDYRGIYEVARRTCTEALVADPGSTALAFHLSSGTPPMAYVWVLLGKTLFPAELLESSKEAGVKTADIPFDIAAEFLPDLLREPDGRLRSQSAADSPPAPEFEEILHRSRVMARLVQRSRRVALRNVPVLIEGESGTGKEMLARAIHRASPRNDKPFIAVNCGAIPESLVESTLFGHEKGSFTGATADKKGHIREANGGTLFLDEIGELPLSAQVKLLRPLQEGRVQPVGSSREYEVDIRILAATNRTVADEVASGRFREDLFYRLAVAVLKIPPLRERPGDLGLLVDELLKQVNREAASEPGYKEKKLSAGARNLVLAHPWPGNVRELLNTLKRAAIWSDAATISAEDVRDALLPVPGAQRRDVLGRPLGAGLNLQEILKEVAQHYLGRALDEAAGNKTRAAELVGVPSYQTLSNWLKKYEVES